MKKILQTGKIWTILSALIFVMMVGFVVYATSLSKDSYFSNRKESSNGTLTLSEWNSLMDNLDSLYVEGGESGEEIPEGMIAPFYSGCPSGWSEYATAPVPGSNTVSREWCVKGGGATTYTVTVTAIVPYIISGTNTYGSKESAVKYFTNVPEGSSVSISGRTITVGSSTWTASDTKSGADGKNYSFSSIYNRSCGSSVTSSCEINVYYKS